MIYSFQILNKEEGEYLYIQQKELDEYRSVHVRGGLTIKFEDYDEFLKELQLFGTARVKTIEPSR